MSSNLSQRANIYAPDWGCIRAQCQERRVSHQVQEVGGLQQGAPYDPNEEPTAEVTKGAFGI